MGPSDECPGSECDYSQLVEMDLATAVTDENIENSVTFDGIVLLICRDVFEFFQRESGNSDDSYHDIYVVPTCTGLQNFKPIMSSFVKDNNEDKTPFTIRT